MQHHDIEVIIIGGFGMLSHQDCYFFFARDPELATAGGVWEYIVQLHKHTHGISIHPYRTTISNN